MLLIAAQALDRHGVAPGRPIDPRQVGGVRVAGGEPGRPTLCDFHHTHLDAGVGLAGLGVLLQLHLGVERGVVHQGVDADRGLVEMVESDAGAVRAPPVPLGLAVPDLLPIDPVGGAVEGDVLLAVRGQTGLGTGGDVEDVEVEAAHEGDAPAVGREPGRLLLGLRAGQPAQGRTGERFEIEVAAGQDEEGVALRRPRVVVDPGLLVFPVLLVLPLGDELTLPQQHLAPARGEVERPEGLLGAVPLLVPDVGQPLAVGGPGGEGRPPAAGVGDDELAHGADRGAGRRLLRSGGHGGGLKSGESPDDERSAHAVLLGGSRKSRTSLAPAVKTATFSRPRP